MTDAPSRRRGGPPVAWVSLSAFAIVLAFLALQLSEGRDPSIGRAKAAPPQPRQLLVRRIVRRTVVVHLIPPPIVDAPPAAVATASPSGTAVATPAQASAAPVQSAAPAPVQAAPPVAAAPAPPPPPPPAPVTRSS